MIGQAATVLLVIVLLPRESAAQGVEPASHETAIHRSIAADTNDERWQTKAPQPGPSGRSRLSRRGWIALGTGIGFGAGLVFGEYYIGRHLDTPHGPDMLIGGGIGAGTGALIAWLVTRSRTNQSSPMFVPIVTTQTKALAVSFPLRARPPAAVQPKSP